MNASKSLNMSTSELGGLYQVVTTKGLDLGFLIAMVTVSSSVERSERIE